MNKRIFVVGASAAATAVALLLGACAPAQTDATTSSGDESTGTLRVWLFSEVNQAPKEAVVNEAKAEFEKSHEGVTVDVQYIGVDTRAERFKAAFNDPASAPDVAEFGNTDLAGYVDAGGLADVTDKIKGWDEAKDFDGDILRTTEISGKNYGIPWYIGVRALYYRTDLFEAAGLKAPTTLAEVESSARAIRAANPQVIGIATGGKAQFSFLPYIWAYGGEIATQSGDAWTAALDSTQARAGVAAYTNLLKDDICPPQTCAEWGGNASVQEFIAGNAAMTIGGDFNRKAVDESAVGDKYSVVPIPGVKTGTIAPAFAGGNNLGVFASSGKQTLAFEFLKVLGSKEYQKKMFDAMGNLSAFTDVQAQSAKDVPELKPFIDTLAAGTKFVPVTPAWNTIDAQGDLATMIQTVVNGSATVDESTATATSTMSAAFAGK